MAKRAGIRKVVKWGGLLVAVLLAIVWVGSCWYFVGWVTRSGQAAFVSGGVIGVREPFRLPRSVQGSFLMFQPDVPAMSWWFDWQNLKSERYAVMPLWIPLLIVAGATATAWRADVRARRLARVGACPACGYDRRGLGVGRVCPECGAAGANDQMAK